MKIWIKTIFCCAVLVISSACAYRYYLGMHGPSMAAFPEVHDGVTEDQECLGCHHPDQASEASATSHPHFTGCLKCHNDEVD